MLKSAGYGLVAVVLVFQMLFMYVPQTRVPALIAFNYVMLGVAITAILANKIAEIIQHSRLRKSAIRCRNCGWFGPGELWDRNKCCPECDSEDVELMNQE